MEGARDVASAILWEIQQQEESMNEQKIKEV